jgi:hypothetical protein
LKQFFGFSGGRGIIEHYWGWPAAPQAMFAALSPSDAEPQTPLRSSGAQKTSIAREALGAAPMRG